MGRCSFFFRHLTAVATLLAAFPAHAQTGKPALTKPETTHTLELRGGYTSGRFAHYTNDYAPTINFFGGGNSQTGQVVDHHFNGVLLGACFVREIQQPTSSRKITMGAGLDVLTASDRLAFADGHRATLPLLAVHPNLTLGIEYNRWLLRGSAGLLLGRVGYYASTTSQGFLSNRTVVDTVNIVPTFTIRAGWHNWIMVDGGYGTDGLLGLANPAWHAGVGTGFGPRSPVAVLFGTSGAESTDYDQVSPDHYYLQLETSPKASRWRATGFFTLGASSYSRVGAKVAYRLPLFSARSAVAE